MGTGVPVCRFRFGGTRSIKAFPGGGIGERITTDSLVGTIIVESWYACHRQAYRFQIRCVSHHVHGRTQWSPHVYSMGNSQSVFYRSSCLESKSAQGIPKFLCTANIISQHNLGGNSPLSILFSDQRPIPKRFAISFLERLWCLRSQTRLYKNISIIRLLLSVDNI